MSTRKQNLLFSSSRASLQPSAMNFCMSVCREEIVSRYYRQKFVCQTIRKHYKHFANHTLLKCCGRKLSVEHITKKTQTRTKTGQSIIGPTGININMFNKTHLSPPQYQHGHYSVNNGEAKQQMGSRSTLFKGFPFLLFSCGRDVIVTTHEGSLGC